MIDNAIADFTAAQTGGTSFVLSKHTGHPVVLYFYPKDNTPGCTTESMQFRDLYSQFASHGAVVVGVSRDSLESHEAFKAKLGLPFELIADPEEALCAQFGVMKMKALYGKNVRGVERSTFLIDRNGAIAREWRGVKVATHAQEVLDAVAAL